MRRIYQFSALTLVIFAGSLLAAEKKDDTAKKDNKNAHKATITKVDAKKHTITVKMKDKEGKEVEKTFTLAEDVRMWDDTGKVAAIDVFQSGNEVLIVEREGKIQEVKKQKAKPTVKPTDKK